jgi:DNA (cytosine-5)-methyltransferase 1
MRELKVLELFAGIGAFSKALTRQGIPHEIVDAVEIDKYAIKSFNAVHGTNFEAQDITKWDKDIECDLIMHGSPCQDFSSAGLQAGGDKGSGTRSSLMYETLRIVERLKPKYVIWENVKNLLSKKHRHNFDAYQEAMKELGYNNHYQVLNAKDYGVPQNRERVFTVSIRNDIEDTFVFPEKQELTVKLKDVLETDVDEKYYISDAMMDYFMGVNQKPSKFPRKERFLQNTNRKDKDRANSITTNPGNRPTYNFVKVERSRQMSNKAYMRNFGSKGKIQDGNGIAATLQAAMGEGGGNVPLVMEPITTRESDITSAMGQGGGQIPMHNYSYRIRKLTPKECWRLMGFDDEDFEKAEKVNSNTQLYKQAGNSIVVNVLEAILGNLIKEKQNGEERQETPDCRI